MVRVNRSAGSLSSAAELGQHLGIAAYKGMRFAPVLLVLSACIGKDLKRPGASLGFYNVTGTLTEDSCGDAPSPWPFRVELRKVEGPSPRLYWAQGDVPIGADLGADGKASFSAESSMVVRAPEAKKSGCTVLRADAVALALAPGQEAFAGNLSYAFSAEQGSVCDNVQKAGITRVPCVVRYTLVGVSVDAGTVDAGALDASASPQ
jgi:hypothetical protein